MVVIFKFETYLGGGETLVIRFSQFMKKNGMPFFVFCKKGSYIHKGLQEAGIDQECFCAIERDCNYFYLDANERKSFIREILGVLPNAKDCKIVTSSMRDLYMVTDLCKQIKASVTHLILHNQDHRYVCRSLIDIIKEKMGGTRAYHNKPALECNWHIIDKLNKNGSLIPMSYIITKLWEYDIGIKIPPERVVSLPAFRGGRPKYGKNDRTILWIGRLVDFKFASLFSLLDFIRDNCNYHLTIAGDGDRKYFMDYVASNGIPMDRITMVGEVAYKDLPSIIEKHAIGYAAGTSIIEIAQQGKPVIMALQANKTRQFKKDICGGVFYNTTKGNLGEDLCIKEEEELTITVADAVAEIERNYELAAQKCFEYVKEEYDQDKNFEKYLNIINTSVEYNGNDILIPDCGFFRRLLYNKQFH